MPLLKHIQINKSCQLALWKITEELEDLIGSVYLSEEDRNKLDSYRSLSRKKEFVVTRLLLGSLLGEDVVIKNDEHGKPFLIGADFEISISHSKDFVAIMIGQNHDMAVDIEYLSDRVYRITKRFMSPDELSFINENEFQLHLYQHWCAKECLIKLYGKKDVHLIDDLKVHPFQPNDNNFYAEVIREDFTQKFCLNHELFDGYLMVWCCQERN